MPRLAFAVLALPLMMGGCGLPPAITAVVYLMDGAALIGTGRTVTDHALSAVTQEDCAVFRLATGEVICQGPGDQGRRSSIALAADRTVYPGEEQPHGVLTGVMTAADPAADLHAATVAPRNDAAATAAVSGGARPGPGPGSWTPVVTIGDGAQPAAVTGRWPIAAAIPTPVGAVVTGDPTAVEARRAGDPAMIRAHQRLLEFRSPIDRLAQQPCTVCPVPIAGHDG